MQPSPSWHRVPWLLTFVLAVACSAKPNPGDNGDDDGGDDDLPVCECTVIGTCCDGCHFITGSCSDGVFCNGTETCSAGVCGSSTGNPCAGIDGDDDCNESCDESAAACTGYDGDGAACVNGAPCNVSSCDAGTCVIEETCPVFVDVGATGSADGTSWANAFTNIQDGVDLAVTTNNARVFVASGTYVAGSGPVLTMAEGVSVYGSFAGTEDRLDQRATPVTRSSILDGDETYRVVLGASNARLDGFTVQRGSVDGVGGGMYSEGASRLVISDVSFVENLSRQGLEDDSGGGGLGLMTGSAALERVLFQGNIASALFVNGGGLYAREVTALTLTDVAFVGNDALAPASGGRGRGGGLAVYESALVTLSRVRFEENDVRVQSSGRGGGAFLMQVQDAVLDEVSFISNIADGRGSSEGGTATGAGLGGALAVDSIGLLTIANSRVAFNFADGNCCVPNRSYSGVVINASEALITNTSFLKNFRGALQASNNSTVVVRFSTFGEARTAIANDSSSFDVTNSVFGGHVALFEQTGTSPEINVTFSCADVDLGAFGANNTLATAMPTVGSAGGRVFLAQGSECVDTASTAAADTLYGIDAWRALVTDIDGVVLEGTSNADPGAHFDRAAAWIKTFVVDATTMSWTIQAPPGATCAVHAEGFDYRVPDAQLAAGSTTHALPARTTVTLECSGDQLMDFAIDRI